MERKIKLIWDMHGPDAEKTAEHHAIHLGEYAEKQSINHFGFGTTIENDLHAIAFLVVEEANMILVRDALKPHRAELYED
ncbi:MAG: hypothetical protein JXR07_13050 [Reichenbachiella sp.]